MDHEGTTFAGARAQIADDSAAKPAITRGPSTDNTAGGGGTGRAPDTHMRSFALLPVFVLVAGIGAVACSAEPADNTAGASSEVNAKAGEGADACSARLRFLQKDAYKEEAGRSNELWPPHTTTVLEVTCDGVTTSSFQANHGTKPDARDAAGKLILVEAEMPDAVVTATGSRAEMDALVASFDSCECASDGFLSLDEVNASALEVVDQVASLFVCGEPTSALVAAAKAKNLPEVQRIFAGCSLRSDLSPAEVQTASAAIDANVKTALVGKHVCNNDAAIQADLFTTFRQTGKAPACNPNDTARCSFPKLFFSPAREIR